MNLTRNRQTTARQGLGVLRLPVSGAILSPYCQRKNTEQIGAGRNTKSFLKYMDFFIDSIGVSGGNPYAVISWWNSSNVFQSSDIVFMTWADVKANGLGATIVAAVNAYGTTNSITVSSIKGIPGTVSGAPQAAIADAPADATTNYNTITTLLGALTGAVNTAKIGRAHV